MVLKGWLLLLLPTAIFVVYAQDATGTCNDALGLSSGSVENAFITTPLSEDSTPSEGRLNNAEGAWCFNNDSIASHSAALIIDLGYKRFVSGFGSQGPPEKIFPKTYNHLIAFSTAYSLDKVMWEEFNDGNLYFDVDKNDTSDVIKYHMSSTVELTQYVKINVTMHISGSTKICLRFEIYGCDTDILPSTNVQALTTPKGKIEVKWKNPSIETSLEPDAVTTGILRPGGYAVLYRPVESQTSATAATGEKMISLEDVRLGATYVIELQCLFKDVVVACGSTQIEAYPPCPEGFTGGNEYHCFLYLDPVSSLSEARTTCLNPKFDKQLGSLGYLVDEEERKLLVSRILPKGSSEFWLIGESCQDKEDCCKVLKVQDDTLQDAECSDKALTSALCLKNHKGEGARLRVSSVEAADDGSSAWFTWRYEGAGWKTDELQVEMWTADGEGSPSLTTFSTLSNNFEIQADVGVMYSLLLRPAPNIRTEEIVYKFIIIDFQEGETRYGAVLTPVPMSIYIIWSGSLRVTWDESKALSKSGEARPADKYSITYQMTSPESASTEVEVENGKEFQLTPITMQASYVFKMSCFFAGSFQPCGEIAITTDPPDLVLYKPSKVYVIYEVIQDKVKNWADAENDCKQRAGHLTSLLDEAEAKALFKMLPNKDSKIWTGAKLGKKGTGYWTDGEKITDLPMAKNSGVTSSSESCCRAINEAGKLKLAGGNCEERYPYICKYTVEEMMSTPGQLTAVDHQWNSFQLSWPQPKERWLPTFYNVRACLKVSKTNCVTKNQLKNSWTLKLENLVQFQNYDVEVEAALLPVDVKTKAQTSVMTYPKSPVRLSISPKGKGSVSCPMLTAQGVPSATVTVTLSQMEKPILTVKGGVSDVVMSGLAPEETYKMEVKQDGGKWTHDMTFDAVPTCLGKDVLVGSDCYSLVEETKNFDEAKKYCSQASEAKTSVDLWIPESDSDLQSVVKDLGTYSNSWIQKPTGGSISNIGSDASCSSKGDVTCCFYDVLTSTILCSACCDQKLLSICSYKVKDAYLGEVAKLLPSFVGNTSIGVEWSAPDDVSWSIRRYELEWINSETLASVGKEVIVGMIEKQIEQLEYGTEYEVKVTPLGAKTLRGKTAKLLITTLDPRTPITVRVDSDGAVQVFSPLLIEKGKGSDPVQAVLYRMDGGNKVPITTVSGEAKRVDIDTELEVGKLYWVQMTPKNNDKMFNYSTEFSAYPSCNENQIQDGLVCVWAPPQTKSWTDAYEVCRGDSGELLDYKTQEELTQPVKALLTSFIQENFWLDMGSEGTAALRDQDSSNCPNGQESEVMCCSYDVSETGELDNLKCACCNEPRPFACKKNAKLNLGVVDDVVVQDVTSNSLTVAWRSASGTKWGKPSYLVTWSELSTRKKRQTANQLVIKDPPASVTDLKAGTRYKVAVAPYTEATKSSGGSKEITVTTKDDAAIAGLMDGFGCMIVIFKISCCITVILGSSFTVFVFIATRMFYSDSLAQIFSELGTLGAYVCILVSSAQSYSNDSQCLTADSTLCVAVSVLIQFFFQVIYMFTFLESAIICTTLKDYLPQCCSFRSPLSMAVCGFGFPAIMMIVLAAVASDGFSDGNDNCWLDLEGKAMLPSVIPVIVFGALSCLILMSVFDADEPKENLPSQLKMRGRLYLRTRWGSFIILVLTSVCYACGMIGVNSRDAILSYVFVGFSTALGILMPIVRIRLDDEVREQLKRGLFTSLRDDLGAIRVSPAPDRYGPTPLLNMPELEKRKLKHRHLEEMKTKESMTTESVWHQ